MTILYIRHNYVTTGVFQKEKLPHFEIAFCSLYIVETHSIFDAWNRSGLDIYCTAS